MDPVIADTSAFDEVAADYDVREAGNPIMQLMRRRSLAMLDEAFPQGSTLLDIGCGTGTEAMWLTKRGRTVFAVDSSPQMLKVLSEQAAATGLSVSSQLLRAGDLSVLLEERGEASFDGAYSSFGALNTEPELRPTFGALARLVRPGGRIVLSVMNRWCAAEIALLAASGRAGEAFRRSRPSVRVRIGSAFTDVTYPSWRQLRRSLQPGFRVVTVQALPLLLVPGAWPGLAPHSRMYTALCRLDAILAPKRPFSWFGDHLFVVAERRTLR
jgi:ubiquinone/menaquinone biosynthesis C-methylase UbiE